MLLLSSYTLAKPIPRPQPASGTFNSNSGGYSGAGGNAIGGSVVASSNTKSGLLDILTGGKSLLSAFSENAGSGGDASSGPSLAGAGGLGRVLKGGGKSSSSSSSKNSKGSTGSIAGVVPGLSDLTASQSANAYSGVGGNAGGGSVSTAGSLLDIFSRKCRTRDWVH